MFDINRCKRAFLITLPFTQKCGWRAASLSLLKPPSSLRCRGKIRTFPTPRFPLCYVDERLGSQVIVLSPEVRTDPTIIRCLSVQSQYPIQWIDRKPPTALRTFVRRSWSHSCPTSWLQSHPTSGTYTPSHGSNLPRANENGYQPWTHYLPCSHITPIGADHLPLRCVGKVHRP